MGGIMGGSEKGLRGGCVSVTVLSREYWKHAVKSKGKTLTELKKRRAKEEKKTSLSFFDDDFFAI